MRVQKGDIVCNTESALRDYFFNMTDDGRRVNLHILNADKQWDEIGTGHVFFRCLECLNLIYLSVKAEGNGVAGLDSLIQSDKKYRREANTVIWLEADCIYIALHFQEEAGCNEIWEKICQVLGKDLSLEIPQDIMENPKNERFDDVSDICSLRLEPIMTVDHLEDFNTFLKTCITSPMRREKLIHVLNNSKDYFTNLIRIIRFRIRMGILKDDDLHAEVRNLVSISSNIILIAILHKKANATSQIESLLQQLNL